MVYFGFRTRLRGSLALAVVAVFLTSAAGGCSILGVGGGADSYTEESVAAYKEANELVVLKGVIENDTGSSVTVHLHHPVSPEAGAHTSHEVAAGATQECFDGDYGIGNDWGVQACTGFFSCSEIYFLGEIATVVDQEYHILVSTLLSGPSDTDDTGGTSEYATEETGAIDGETGATGVLTAFNVPVSGIEVSRIDIRYDMGAFFGEPTRLAEVKWEGSGTMYGVTWAAEVHGSSGPHTVGGEPVYVSYPVGTIPDAGEDWGWDTTGSPSWTDVFVFFDPQSQSVSTGIGEDSAKAIYSADFTLKNLVIITVNDESAAY